MLVRMSPPAKKPKPTPKKPSTPAKKAPSGGKSFPAAFAALLKARKIPVPKGLLDAPPEAYASQPASFVESLERSSASELKRFAEQVAGYAERRRQRVLSEWDRHPLIGELRRRGLKEPAAPTHGGFSVSLTKPFKEWSDKEILAAAAEWSKRSH